MNAELVKKAAEKILDPYILINLVSRRVRQLNAGARPLIVGIPNLGLADTALLEIIEDKLGFEMPEIIELVRPAAQIRRKPAGWGRPQAAKIKLAA